MKSLYGPSRELATWAERAGYAVTFSREANATMFWSDPGGETRYPCRTQDDGWIRLTQVTRDGSEDLVLDAGSVGVLERFLTARLGNVIRDELGLDVLRVPWSEDQIADRCEITDMGADGLRALLLDGEIIAKAPEPTLSLLALVPLSRYMRLSAADLRASFVDPYGAPLLSGGTYA